MQSVVKMINFVFILYAIKCNLTFSQQQFLVTLRFSKLNHNFDKNYFIYFLVTILPFKCQNAFTVVGGLKKYF